ncbi:MAG TPA: hypothetical protein VFJ91_05290 [Gaiellaceae bacterium]|nr:hypothetical protein [Gaiellaceae bacterium]
MRRALTLLVVAAGVALILVGVAVGRRGDALDRSRAALAEPLPEPTVAPAGGIPTALLGSGGDERSLRAAAAYVHARSVPAATASAARLAAERLLAPLAAGGPAARRSWASTLLGVLELDAAQASGAAARGHVAAAAGELAAAVAADPANEDAKRDLELLLTLRPPGSRDSSSQNRARRHQPSRNRRSPAKGPKHAGLSAAGSGW